MARKRNQQATGNNGQRRSRKEVLLARKEARQTRQIRLAAAGVLGLLLLVFLVAIVNEFIVAPNRAVATVNGEEITLEEWQDRVRYERAQRIILLENQYEALGGNVGFIQQFAGQTIQELQEAETLGQSVLDLMVNETAARQAAQARGITVTAADVDEVIEESFNYFGGESPTPFPTPTETVMPTPSLTPVPTAVITEVVPTAPPFPTPTTGPTPTRLPTATPVSQEAFQEQYNDLLSQLQELGVEEETYRSVVRSQLYIERLTEALAEERELSEEAEQASIFVLSFATEEAANEALDQIEEQGFLDVWNTIRSTPASVGEEGEPVARATETVWQTQDTIESSFGSAIAEAAFDLSLNTPSDVLVQEDAATGTSQYYIIQVSGREVRPLSEQELTNNRRQLVTNFIDQQLVGGLDISEFWRNRVPTQPLLDPKFLAPPTPTVQSPILPEPGEDEGDTEPLPIQPIPTSPPSGGE